MCPRSDRRRVVPALLIALAALLPAAPTVADEMALYLERHGLDALLVAHLEGRREQVRDDDERAALLARLADLYARLLGATDDPAERLALQERARRLLADADPERSDGLRLALLRAQYRGVEETAERDRLGLADATELAAARVASAELVADLEALVAQLDERAEREVRRLARATGTAARLREEATDRFLELGMQSRFLLAWALHYRARLDARSDLARKAEELFESLLGLDESVPIPANVSVDRRGDESFARCILGLALSRSMTSTTSAALEWLLLLEHERTWEPLRAQVPAWRIAIRIDHDEFSAVRAELEGLLAEATPPPLPWLRLAAVGALAARGRTSRADDLARVALAALATRGELGQVFDLASRYGDEALGTQGFAARYVRGVLRYYAGRERAPGDEPTTDSLAIDRFREATTEFDAALGASDADEHEAAAADCLRLLAWSRYFAGDLLDARKDFIRAASLLPAGEAPDALWMAIVCLDDLVEADPANVDLADELAATIGTFLREHPSSPHAGKLVLRRVIASGETTPEAASALLAIPEGSDVAPAARRKAAQICYQLFRDRRGAERVEQGLRFLEVVAPLFEDDVAAYDEDPSDPVRRDRLLVSARRILEVALQDDVARIEEARGAFQVLTERAGTLAPALEEIAGELDYRRLLERLASGASSEAADLADRLNLAAPDLVWTRLANRAMLSRARDAWRDATGGDDRALVDAIIRYGERVLAEYDDDSDALANPSVASIQLVVAEASAAAWRRSRDEARGRRALELYEELLDSRPTSASFLRETARLAGEFGDDDRAVACWRRLVAGLPQGEEAWYEAKFHLLQILARTDAGHAREVMNQHRVLDPEYGPDPWGARLRALDERLRIAVPGAPVAPVASGEGGAT